MILLIGLHALIGTVMLVGAARWGRRASYLGLVPTVATVAWLGSKMGQILDGRPVLQEQEWMPGLGVDLTFKIDGFSAVMILLISGIGALIFAYSASYFPRGGVRIGRLMGLLTLFSGAMLGVVVADNLLILYGFWELTSITSFLLIGNDHEKADARASALHALLVTGAGGLAMLAGFLMLGSESGTYQFSAILADPPSGTVVEVALVLILLGAFTKSAQYPFHAWLPGAMVAPTPVSAYLHSATMVKAGVYLVARLSPAFADHVGWWRAVVIGVGLFTMLAGGLRAMRQHDLKVLLAHGTVSQLGFMMVAFGIGTPEAMAAGAILLLGHGAFKATNFMVVGILDHQYGTRDLRVLPRLDRSWLAVGIAAVVGAASMGGVPLALGFIVKEAVLEAIVDLQELTGSLLGPYGLVLVLVVVGSAFTAAYSLRFARGALGHDATEPIDTEPASVKPSTRFVAPAMVLVALTVVLGVAPSWLDGLDTAAQQSLLPNVEDHYKVYLALWHGVGPALIASVIALSAGTALYLGRRRVGPILATGRAIPDAGDAYLLALRGLNRLADRVTAISQPGSLPVYAGVILVTAAVVPLWALTTGESWPGWPQLVETPAHIPVVAVLLIAALAASVVRRRFSAALFLGIAGYAMAALFVVQGAPDLALTQVAIETLTTVLFVLVLRRLPDRFGWAGSGEAPIRISSKEHATASELVDDEQIDPPDSVMTTGRRALRLLAALTVGTSVFILALVMSGADPETPTSQAMIERAEPEGHGRNIVNVTLVDFRGFDTLGEITVLASAAIGTVALARAGRRPRHAPNPEETDGRNAPPLRLPRLITLEVSVRVVFAVVMVGSIYLLFAGHNQPGGGFVGGILAGAAVALRYLAGGIDAVRSLSRGKPWTVLGLGLLLAAGTALIPVLLGEPVLANGLIELDLPLIGKLKATSAAVFDLGVYLAVLGLALMMFESFGDDPVDEEPLIDTVRSGDTPR